MSSQNSRLVLENVTNLPKIAMLKNLRFTIAVYDFVKHIKYKISSFMPETIASVPLSHIKINFH